MTDEQIVKALRLCAIDVDVCTEACPYYEDREYFDGDCIKQRTIDAIDLINRQKAEIERLNHIRAELSRESDRLEEAYSIYEETTGLKQARAEAIREFVERLFERVAVKTLVGKSEDYSDGFIEATCWYDEEIDNLVKEMTEGQP
jgi:hypothetical protein